MSEAISQRAMLSAQSEAFVARVTGLIQSGQTEEALKLAEECLLDPDLSVAATCALAGLYYRAGALGYAVKFLLELVNRADCPDGVADLLGVLYCVAGNLTEGLYYGKLSTLGGTSPELIALFGEQFPSFADAMATIMSKPLLGGARVNLTANNYERALFMVEQHLCIFPNDVEALDVYAQVLVLQGKLPEAVGMLRSISTLAGPSATLLGRLGNCLIRSGNLVEGLACHHEAIARAPNSAQVLGAAMSDLRYADPALAVASGIPEAWMRALAAQAPRTVRPAPKYAGQQPVRIGYLCAGQDSAEMRAMIGAVATAHDRSRVTVVGFGSGESDAEGNEWTRGAFDHWRDVSALDVATLGALVRGEGIHVLIDADGVLAPAKCGLFQRNSAPVQISWLNAPAGTRLPGNYLACVAGTAEAAEGEIRLASGRYLLAQPVAAAGPTPVLADGNIAYGAELTLAEFNPRLAMAWGRILQAVPGSMLLLRDTGLFDDKDDVNRVVNLFGNAGIAHRIELIQGTSRAEFAAGIDIALMPLPAANVLAYGEFLAAGVPVVAARAFPGGDDIGAALASAGLGDVLSATTIDEYVAVAVGLAADTEALGQLRSRIPAALADVPAFSAKAFARSLEEAFLAALPQ